MSESRDLQDWRSDLLRSIGLGVAYYVAAQLSLRLALVGENITPLWPPTGIALVGFLLRGRRLWPGVAIAAFVVNLPISATPVAPESRCRHVLSLAGIKSTVLLEATVDAARARLQDPSA